MILLLSAALAAAPRFDWPVDTPVDIVVEGSTRRDGGEADSYRVAFVAEARAVDGERHVLVRGVQATGADDGFGAALVANLGAMGGIRLDDTGHFLGLLSPGATGRAMEQPYDGLLTVPPDVAEQAWRAQWETWVEAPLQAARDPRDQWTTEASVVFATGAVPAKLDIQVQRDAPCRDAAKRCLSWVVSTSVDPDAAKAALGPPMAKAQPGAVLEAFDKTSVTSVILQPSRGLPETVSVVERIRTTTRLGAQQVTQSQEVRTTTTFTLRSP